LPEGSWRARSTPETVLAVGRPQPSNAEDDDDDGDDDEPVPPLAPDSEDE